jgi:DNA primase
MDSTVEAIKERLTAAEIIGRRVQLQQAGRNLRGLCCFHTEKTPSFFVFPDSNTFKCFGCNEGGDIFEFVMKTENLEFRDALSQLAEEADVPLTQTNKDSNTATARKTTIDANTAAAGFFRQELGSEGPDADHARAYATKRGVDETTQEQFQIGFARDSWNALRTYMNKLGHTDETLVKAGLARRGESGIYDVFRNRLIFPIIDRRGDIIGFGGRTLGDDPAKYMNTPQTEAFDKGRVLYGLPIAREAIRETKSVVIVEGYMDVLAAHQNNYNNVVAAMGTAITPSQVRLLRGISKRIVIALDADTAGIAATRRSLELVSRFPTDQAKPVLNSLVQYENRAEADIFVAALPNGKDPDDVIRDSPTKWERLINEAAPLADYLFKAITSELDYSSPLARTEAMAKAVSIIHGITQPAVRALYIGRLALLLRVPEDEIERQLRKQPRRQGKPSSIASNNSKTVRHRDDYFLAVGLTNLKYFRRIANLVQAEDYSSSENRLLADYFSKFIISDGNPTFESMRKDLDVSLLDRFDTIEKLHLTLPPSEGEELFREMQRIALQLRYDGLRAENRQLQMIQADGESMRDNKFLAKRQREVLVEIREIAKAID